MKQFLKKIQNRLFKSTNDKQSNAKGILNILIENGLTVGEKFNMLPECIIDFSHCWHIKIGNHVTLAPRVCILAHDASTKMHLDHTKVKNVVIGDYVFIGAASIIMPGVTIGNQVVIGAGSVVTKDVPNNSVVAGNPAKFVCSLEEYLKREQKAMHSSNTFGSDYTLDEHLTDDMKAQMLETIKNHGVLYVY